MLLILRILVLKLILQSNDNLKVKHFKNIFATLAQSSYTSDLPVAYGAVHIFTCVSYAEARFTL